ncbi:DedA family protein [Humisphaera borealis]|uniref:DedA family protein n=1 Tax=Humisphaera borealis TaxID=2807512 RepID=A0A7M2WT54_9BACT|nr:DedA family protein [Humisphaera borealis]QOV88599.1 DedA family protein [Humisphaera borealis]
MLATTALDVMAALQINAGQGVALAARIINADKVEDWVAYGGPWMVFGLLFLCGLGFPLPEEIPIMAAGYFIGTGRMGWALTCVLAWCGIIAGDCILYWFGRRYGLNITRIKLVGKHFTKERILKAEHLFERWGVWVVAIGRLISGVRGVMCVAAGAIKYNFVKFLIVDGLAALVSGGIFIFLGWWLGKTLGDFDKAVAKVEPYVELFVTLATVGLLGFILYLYIRHRRKKGVTDVALTKAVEFADKHPGKGV